jgi:hypothetical protein
MKKFIVLAIFVLILAGLFAYYSVPRQEQLSQAQKEQKLTDLLGRKVDLSDKKPQADKKFEGKFVSFMYPADAVIYAHREAGSTGTLGSLESFSYDLKSPKVVFNYQVFSSIKSLDDLPSFRLRALAERAYVSENIAVKEFSGTLFKKDEGQISERSLFVYKSDKAYIFVLTGSDPETLDGVMDFLTGTLEFAK